MGKIDSVLISSKFRGSFLGGLLGDCLGGPFEGQSTLDAGELLVLRNYLDKLEGPNFSCKFFLTFLLFYYDYFPGKLHRNHFRMIRP